MFSNIRNVIGIVIAIGMLCFLTGCGVREASNNPVQEKPAASEVQKPNPVKHEEIMEKYITDFLTKGYSKYYTINSITFTDWNKKADNGIMEAVVLTTMNSSISQEYMNEIKEKSEKETDPKKSEALKEQYKILQNDFGRASDSNFMFKLTASLKNDEIDEKTISLYLEQDAENNTVIYIPAEEILP